jgi:predicted Zn finger-like uncharacterized protein
MIIECKNCLKKFVVRDSDISINGRIVKCGNCSSQWLQKPISFPTKTKNLDTGKVTSEINLSVTNNNLNKDKELLEKELTASDGKNYKFLGNQWAEIHPSGKSGRLAKKKISNELNKLVGRKIVNKKKIVKKSKQLSNQYQEKQKGMGVFTVLTVSVLFVAAVILLLYTFEKQIISFWPNLEIYLVYIFETVNNIYIIIKDLFNNYK